MNAFTKNECQNPKKIKYKHEFFIEKLISFLVQVFHRKYFFIKQIFTASFFKSFSFHLCYQNF